MRVAHLCWAKGGTETSEARARGGCSSSGIMFVGQCKGNRKENYLGRKLSLSSASQVGVARASVSFSLPSQKYIIVNVVGVQHCPVVWKPNHHSVHDRRLNAFLNEAGRYCNDRDCRQNVLFSFTGTLTTLYSQFHCHSYVSDTTYICVYTSLQQDFCKPYILSTTVSTVSLIKLDRTE